MCNFDWGLFANVVTAIGTVALAVVGAFAARYAYNTAVAAIHALQLESEPILMAGVDPDGVADRMGVVKDGDDGRFLFLPTTSLDDIGTAYFTIRNIGRSAAVNVRAHFVIRDVASKKQTEFPLFIESLLPEERFVLGIHNATSTAVNVTVDGATKASISRKGKLEQAQVFLSSALPFPLGY